MTIATLFSYLVGNRAAIVRIATTRGAVWIGALLVLSAGLAREYDADDLVAEPWHLLIPFGASLGTSFLLYRLVHWAALQRTVEPPSFARNFVIFLTLYWMTAPLAWLYALPVERWMSAVDATRANVWLLAIVSIWRVFLMTRVLHVLFGASVGAAFWLVMLFADTVALALLCFLPVPIISIMGGIQLSESDRVIQSVGSMVCFFGGLSWLVWFFGTCSITCNPNRDWRPVPVASTPSIRARPAVWCFAGSTILAWGLVLPFTQPEQQLRTSVESRLTDNDIAGALRLMSQHDRQDFPPHWIPPPNRARFQPQPSLLDILEATLDDDVAPWVRRIFVEKLEAELSNDWSFFHWYWRQLKAEQKVQLLNIVDRLPEGVRLVKQHERAFRDIASQKEDSEQRDKARALWTKAGLDPGKLDEAQD